MQKSFATFTWVKVNSLLELIEEDQFQLKCLTYWLTSSFPNCSFISTISSSPCIIENLCYLSSQLKKVVHPRYYFAVYLELVPTHYVHEGHSHRISITVSSSWSQTCTLDLAVPYAFWGWFVLVGNSKGVNKLKSLTVDISVYWEKKRKSNTEMLRV